MRHSHNPARSRAATQAFGLLGPTVWLSLVVSGCFDPLPDPVIGCTTAVECPSGSCVSGVCQPLQIAQDIGGDAVARNDDTAGGDDVAADTADAGPNVCTSNAQCEGLFTDLSPCQAPVCSDGNCQLVVLPKGATCTDGTLCPVTGNCAFLKCETGSKVPCDDDNACTFDACGLGGCTHKAEPDGTACEDDGLVCTDDECVEGQCVAQVRANTCLIGGYCYLKEESNPSAPCQRCLPTSLAAQVTWTSLTGGPCDDGDACTIDDGCDAKAVCAGVATNCLDDNPCTEDACEPALGCQHLPNAATCTDDDPCSLFGQCADGKCGPGAAVSCDDGNPCTVDSCVPKLGCVHVPHEGACVADANPCTDDVCLGGACVAKPAVDVCKVGGTCVKAGAKADGNACLICNPTADPKGWTVLVGVKCEDGNLCTAFDLCVEGKCTGEEAKCADNNPCTEDACAPLQGCVFSPILQPCDDNSACTVGDLCVAGKCLGTPIGQADCDDGNPCTDDLCSPAVGCTSAPNNAPCDDGDKCTKGDICSATKCISGEVVCPCETHADCNDSNPCTQDACIKGQGCINPMLDPKSACDDANACTQDDHCVNGLCKGSAVNCDDGNNCTKDGCAAESGCTEVNLQGVACSDGNNCTKDDLCIDGVCKGAPKSCDDGNPCSADLCDPASGACSHVDAPMGSPCGDDGAACTVDQCLDGQCNHATVHPEFCLIDNYCYSGGAPHPAKQCLGCQPLKSPTGWSVLVGNGCFDYDACTSETVCNAQGACVGKPVNCDDANPCTKDACNPQASGANGCVHAATEGVCDDGSACTQGDACSGGQCSGKPVDCDDANPCTIASCDPVSGCQALPAADGLPCPDDGAACTSDACANKTCTHVPKAGWCHIAGQCQADGTKAGGTPCLGCAAAVDATKWTFIAGGTCDDGDPCTAADICKGGSCQGETAKACDDGNPCTIDSCDTKKGCAHLPKVGACDDGNACTSEDTCVDGACVSGPDVQCTQGPDNNDCTIVTCVPSQGCVNVSTCGALHQCVAGLCLTREDQKTPGPVALPLGAISAKQPLRPTLAWQESHTGPMGAVPQLWLAAQTNGCAPAVGLYSGVFTVALRAGEAKPTVQLLATPDPAGGANWCAAQPVLRPHPTSFNAVVLGWLEGGHAQSACAITSSGGRVRVGLLGLGGQGIALAPAAACPTGAPAAPLSGRPDFALVSGGSGDGLSPSTLGGVLFRGSQAGPMWFGGNAIASWGGKDGKLLTPLTAPGMIEQTSSSRPVAVPMPPGSLLLSTSRLQPVSGWGTPVLTGQRYDAKGQPEGARAVLVQGVALQGEKAVYHSVEAAYDADAKRVGVLISGSDELAGQPRSFLAFARVLPGQAQIVDPKLAVFLSWPAGVTTNTLIRAYRIAKIPSTDDFLVIWAAPGSTVLKALRIMPDKLGENFATKEIAAIANNFVGQDLSTSIDSSGGLSEIAIDPPATRYSIAWEGVAAVHLLTAPLPKP